MKVILLQDVHKVGKKYQIAEVSPGFARNFLLPQKKADVATNATLKRYDQLRQRHEQEQAMKHELLAKSLGDLATMTVKMHGKSNEHGHLFAGLHQGTIAEAIKEQTDIDLAPEHIVLKKPIKEAGTYPIQIVIGEHRGKVTLEVEGISEE
jgi:large subunit ribosomal protein L9